MWQPLDQLELSVTGALLWLTVPGKDFQEIHLPAILKEPSSMIDRFPFSVEMCNKCIALSEKMAWCVAYSCPLSP